MKTSFKPLGIAAAVAAATAAYTGVTNAQLAGNQLGDAAIVPYYSVKEGFATGVHIINTTDATQVVKLRFRRGDDSLDALDFNLIMSPYDEWTGYIDAENDGGPEDEIAVVSGDDTCTVPAGEPFGDGLFKYVMPDTGSIDTVVNFRDGAEEGYVEIIGMAEADPNQPISVGALHDADGIPADCDDVRENFRRFAGADAARGVDVTIPGVHTNAVTSNGKAASVYVGTRADAFKVSWFTRDANGGLEFGGNAVHIRDFAADPMMTNQQPIAANQVDPLGYLFPDLDGGSPGPFGSPRGLYDTVVRPTLGAATIINDWASRRNEDAGFTVNTDWVITLPGQYLMVEPEQYLLSLLDEDEDCDPVVCDTRDIPVEVNLGDVYDREEQSFTAPPGGFVVSPAINITPAGVLLPFEVNVMEWVKEGTNVLGSQYATTYTPGVDATAGWANLSVTPNPLGNKPPAVWDLNDPNGPTAVPVSTTAVPIIGFAVWERNFDDNPSANFGRAIDHSYGS